MANARDELHKLEIFVNEEMGIKTFNQSGWHIAGTDSYEKVDEHLQALEIIVKKSVNIVKLRSGTSLEDYNLYGICRLTETEYDLVSKVVKEIKNGK